MENLPNTMPREIEYFHSTDHTALLLLRVLAVLGVVLAAGTLGGNAAALILPEFRQNIAWSSRLAPWFAGTYVLNFTTSLLLLVGSIMVLQRRPRGRGALLAYAYGHFVLIIYSSIVNSCWMLSFYNGRNYSSWFKLTVVSQVAVQWLSTITLPLVFALLLSRPEFRRVFRED